MGPSFETPCCARLLRMRSERLARRERLSRLLRQEARVAADGGGVDGDDLLPCEAVQVIRATGLGTGPREAGAAERLGADHGTDHAAVDIDVAHGKTRHHLTHRRVDARLDAEGEAVAARRDIVEELWKFLGAVA